MTFGLSAAGFQRKQASDIQASISGNQKLSFGSAWASDVPTSVVGQLNGSIINELDDLWQLANVVWASQNIGTAGGISLDLILQELGVRRQLATASTVTLHITGTNGTTIPSSFEAKVPSTGATFQVNAGGTISGTTIDLAATCITTGPIIAPAGTITQIVTPQAGISAVTNTLDAMPGQNVATDAQTRTFAAQEQTPQAAAIVEAIRSAILRVTGVTQCLVYNNPSGVTDSNGVPAHSFAPVVIGGANQDIFNAIFAAAPAGIGIYGSTSGTVTDPQGIAQPVALSRPSLIQAYVSSDLNQDPAHYGGDATVAAAVAAYGDTLQIAQTLQWNRLFGVIYGSTTGINEINNLFIGTAPSPVGTTDITAGPFQLIEIQVGHVVITP